MTRPNPWESNRHPTWELVDMFGNIISSNALLVGLKGYRSSDDTYQPLRLDKATNSIQVVDYPHHEIHAGSYFLARHYASGKNDGDTINIYIKTSNTASWGHMFMRWSTSGAAYAFIQEAPTVTSNSGTNAQAIINHNRNSSDASLMLDNATTPAVNKYGKDVTIIVPGAIIWSDFSGSGRTSGGSGRNEDEIILKQNTAYCFIVESDAAGLTLSVLLDWYEHTNIA